jgi:BirA family transcriptional regulator, biotin operon repressor / biotin---[acetyl-CoA-carboxylase] ligase
VIGTPRLHLRRVDSTNTRARALAATGAPHGTLVTATEQTAGRGRQGRTWMAPPGRALLASVVLRDPPALLTLATGLAVADVAGPRARLKWPNDVLVAGEKLAGVLVEARPQDGWAVVGIGINVAVRPDDLPAGLRGRAATLGREPADVESVLGQLLAALERWTAAPAADVLAAWPARDALAGREVAWSDGRGRVVGLDDQGRLLVETAGGRVSLAAGEVHLAELDGGR